MAVVVAVVMTGALLGFAALAVDTGRLFGEHRQLRNGGDFAALAVARVCSGAASCTRSTATSVALAAAKANDSTDLAVGGAVVVRRVCGNLSTNLVACPSPSGSGSPLTACTSPLPTARKYVQVEVSTGTPDGRNAVAPVFGQKSNDGLDPVRADPTPVGSCARAGVMGTPKSLVSGLPITVNRCVVDQYKAAHRTATGSPDFAPAPPYTSNRATYETAIVLHRGGKGDDCTDSAGKNAPGNFGYIEDGGDECPVQTSVDSTIGGDTGNALTKDCDTDYLNGLINTVVFLPVFDPDRVSGSGSNTSYYVTGYVPFYVTGWKFPGKSNDAGVTQTCASNSTCVYGMYIRGVAPSGTSYDTSKDPAVLGTAVVSRLD